MRILVFILCFAVLIFAHSCIISNKDIAENNYLTFDLDKIPFKNLSEYGFFEGDIKNLDPGKGVHPYDLTSPLFSDYASKERFIYIPQGTEMSYQGDFSVLEFPVGSIIIKNFYYPLDARNPDHGRNIIETRLLVKKDNGWKPYEYKWDDEQTDATRLVVGATVSASTILENGEPLEVSGYVIPRELDCRTCHNLNGKMTPIGPKPAALNRMISHADTTNQLIDWKLRGILAGMPSESEILPDYRNRKVDPVIRGRAYLDSNCGFCHQPGGTANANGLYVNWAYSGDDINRGMHKIPSNFNAPHLQYDIVPGEPEQSILLYRMTQTKAPDVMPQIGRSMNHKEGIEIIRDYILNL